MWYSLWGKIKFKFSIKKSLKNLGSVVKHRSLKLKSVIQAWTHRLFFFFFPSFSFLHFLSSFVFFFFQPSSLLSTLISLPFSPPLFPSFFSILLLSPPPPPPFSLQIPTFSCEKLKNHLKIGRLNEKIHTCTQNFFFNL